ncbi:MAG: hypothetical protein AAGK93_10935 [Pseudomonadota bacterium]
MTVSCEGLAAPSEYWLVERYYNIEILAIELQQDSGNSPTPDQL